MVMGIVAVISLRSSSPPCQGLVTAVGHPKAPESRARPEHGRLLPGITPATVLVLAFRRVTLSLGLFEIQTYSSTVIQSGARAPRRWRQA